MQQRAAVDQLILDYTKLVKKVANESFHADRSDPDLLQCGMIGLWEAAVRWDGPPRPFAPLAKTCIRHNMMDYMRRKRRWGPTLESDKEPKSTPCEDEFLARLDLNAAIRNTFPENSRDAYVLRALSGGVSKCAAAAALGLDTKQVSVIARAAYRKLKKE